MVVHDQCATPAPRQLGLGTGRPPSLPAPHPESVGGGRSDLHEHEALDVVELVAGEVHVELHGTSCAGGEFKVDFGFLPRGQPCHAGTERGGEREGVTGREQAGFSRQGPFRGSLGKQVWGRYGGGRSRLPPHTHTHAHTLTPHRGYPGSTTRPDCWQAF